MYAAAKRSVDVVAAGVGLVLLAPAMAVLMIGIRRSVGSPVFFRQQRPGLGGRPFTLLKFRTMSDARDADGNLLPDGQRLTRFGRLVRSLSLDELPQLWNVLRGDMSLVGPRPLLMEYLDRYTGEQARRHEVRPGITGLAQVNGRNARGWDERLAMDVAYVDNRSLALDAKLLWQTFFKVAKRDGVSAPGHDTCAPFLGKEATHD